MEPPKLLASPEQNPCRCVVKITTSAYSTSRGLEIKKQIRYLRRRCIGYNLLEEEISATDAETVASHFTNLGSVPDGVYEVVMTDICRDWEYGEINSYALTLRAVE